MKDILKMIKKLIAKEFLWFLFVAVISLPLAYLFLVCLDIVNESNTQTEAEKIFTLELFLFGYVFNFIGVYLIRFIILAAKAVGQKQTQ